MQPTGILVLAAGKSSRLGQPKQLLPFQGKPLLQHLLDQATGMPGSPKVLVLGAYSDHILASITPGSFQTTINEAWEEGLASSIRHGVSFALELQPDLQNLLILLADQPFISTEHLLNLLSVHEQMQQPITCSAYKETLGVPAIFDRTLFEALLQLEGDRGAGLLIKKFGDAVVSLPFEAAAFDVDTIDDYQALVNRQPGK